jgi:hypothetical protein
MIEQLRYELGESSAAQMASFCAISDSEVELSAAKYKGDPGRITTQHDSPTHVDRGTDIPDEAVNGMDNQETCATGDTCNKEG